MLAVRGFPRLVVLDAVDPLCTNLIPQAQMGNRDDGARSDYGSNAKCIR